MALSEAEVFGSAPQDVAATQAVRGGIFRIIEGRACELNAIGLVTGHCILGSSVRHLTIRIRWRAHGLPHRDQAASRRGNHRGRGAHRWRRLRLYRPRSLTTGGCSVQLRHGAQRLLRSAAC